MHSSSVSMVFSLSDSVTEGRVYPRTHFVEEAVFSHQGRCDCGQLLWSFCCCELSVWRWHGGLSPGAESAKTRGGEMKRLLFTDPFVIVSSVWHHTEAIKLCSHLIYVVRLKVRSPIYSSLFRLARTMQVIARYWPNNRAKTASIGCSWSVSTKNSFQLSTPSYSLPQWMEFGLTNSNSPTSIRDQRVGSSVVGFPEKLTSNYLTPFTE